MVKTIEKESYELYSRWYGRTVTYTPVFWIDKDGGEHFVKNRISNSGRSYDEEQDERDIRRMLEILESNNFRFMPVYLKCWHTNFPVESAEGYLEWKEENGYTFNKEMTEKFMDDDGTVYFSGNLNEYSAAFRFAVYDSELLKRWGEAYARDGISQ